MASRVTTKTNAEASDVLFQDFVRVCEFPSYVIISGGQFSDKIAQVCEGDILMLKSLDQRKVTLTYNKNKKLCREVQATLDEKLKFFILSPKQTETNLDDHSTIMYPTISDLLIDCPTYFEATSAYDDPYLPEVSFKPGDRFRFVKSTITKRGSIGLLAEDHKDKAVILTPDCRGNFRPLDDPKQYNLKKILDLPPVHRRLMRVRSGKPNDSVEIPKACVKQNEDTAIECRDTCNSEQGELVEQSEPIDQLDEAASRLSESKGVEDKSCLIEQTVGSINPSHSSDQHDTNLATSTSTSPDRISDNMNAIPPSTVFHFSPTVLASLYSDSSVVLEIPISADLRVKSYSPSDYEVPQVKRLDRIPPRVDIPLPPLSPGEDMPKFIAPRAPPLPQPIVPLDINSFADIYTASLPAVAKLLDVSKCHQFWKRFLENTYDLNVFRVEDENRLFVKDCKSQDVYSLSQDLDISFLEYPEKFTDVSELLSLPIGSELTVLEDIASDYPKPISLRFGDTIRICTNTPQFVKMKYGNRDCEVLKVEKFDPGGIEPTKLKLPTDFEVQMSMSNNSGSLKPIALSKILWGPASVPSRVVAILPGEEDYQKELLRDLPSDVTILRPMKQPVLVVASNSSQSTYSRHGIDSTSDMPGDFPNSLGLPLTCGAILAFQGRLDNSDVDLEHFNADYVRLPVEKLTMSEFEERERLRKLNCDYEDIEANQNGSNRCVNESGLQESNLHRTLSAGALERREKRSKIDKVRRLSRALNPKHWRHSRQEPGPLPHPSAMGLMALAARPPSGTQNDYHHEQVDRASSLNSGSTNTEASTDDEEEENFYEDVDIGPIKSATMESKLPDTNKTRSGFSSLLYKSLPSPRRHRRQREVNKAPPWDSRGETGNSDVDKVHGARGADASVTRERDISSVDEPKSRSIDKALRWATKLGDKIQQDMPSIGRTREAKDRNKDVQTMRKAPNLPPLSNFSSDMSGASSPPSDRAPSPPVAPPPRIASLGIVRDTPAPIKAKGFKGQDDGPVAPARRKRAPAKTLQNSEEPSTASLGEKSSSENNDSISISKSETSSFPKDLGKVNPKVQPIPRKSLQQTEKASESSQKSTNVEAPKPKPRGLKSQISTQPMPSVSDVIHTMDSLAVDKSRNGVIAGKEDSSINTTKVTKRPPPIKPRTF